MFIKTDAVIIEKPFVATHRQIHLSVPQQHNLIVEVGLSGVCTPEQRVFRGASTKNYPYWGGHELFGEIKEIINSSSNFNIGDRVVIALMSRCGKCPYCKSGLDNHCAYVNRVEEYYDLFSGPRGFSKTISIPDYKAFIAPRELPFKYLALIEPTACVLRSIKSSKPLNKNIGIIGSGTMGLIHSIILSTLNYNIFIFDDRITDLEKAKKIPVSETLPLSFINRDKIFELTNGIGISTFFCTRYGSSTIEKAIKSVNRNGEIVLFQSIPIESELLIDFNFLHYNEIKLIGTIAQSQEDLYETIFFMKNNFKLFDCLRVIKMPFNSPTDIFKNSLDLDINRVQIEFNQL